MSLETCPCCGWEIQDESEATMHESNTRGICDWWIEIQSVADGIHRWAKQHPEQFAKILQMKRDMDYFASINEWADVHIVSELLTNTLWEQMDADNWLDSTQYDDIWACAYDKALREWQYE